MSVCTTSYQLGMEALPSDCLRQQLRTLLVQVLTVPALLPLVFLWVTLPETHRSPGQGSLEVARCSHSNQRDLKLSAAEEPFQCVFSNCILWRCTSRLAVLKGMAHSWQPQHAASKESGRKGALLRVMLLRRVPHYRGKTRDWYLFNQWTFSTSLGFHSSCNCRHGGCSAGSSCWLGAVQEAAVLRHCPAWLCPPAPCWVRVAGAVPTVPAKAPWAAGCPPPASGPSTCWETQQKMLQGNTKSFNMHLLFSIHQYYFQILMNYFNFTYFNQNQMEYIKLVNLL